ncbi:uncharacterized protein LOC118407579 [Branchiostoma floridae]|uniref:Uncharacterized protein LOC118407579 n=1 Tax=Branchiostoma floridae TaxID=7739 RepID=A0A9J7HQL0_BRAFL|nr:uncharacterized protein LOC118407579 [Branchiostoma floridae]
MAARPRLPTEEEIDQMKPLKLARLLLDFGMTEDETDKMEKEEARAELKKRIRDMRAMAATRRRPGQITEMLQRAMFENKMKRGRLTQICSSILDFVDSMDNDDKQKMSEIFGQDLRVVLTDVWTFLQDDNCPILVVGETSSGKSSLLNLLLGEDILPVSHLASTSTLCFVRHGEVKKATIYLTEGNTSSTAGIDLQDAGRAKEELASYVHRWGNEDATGVQKVVIEWPLESLQDGICLVDGPGIMSTLQMDEVVAGAVSSTCAFIYMINSAIPLKPASSFSAGGEGIDDHTDGLSRLLKLCQNHKWGDAFNMSRFDLKSTMFVCNKWDSVKQDESEVVKNDYLKKLKDHFPELRDDQVFFLSCNKAVSPAGQLSPEFSRLLDGLDKLLPQSLQHKLELQYQHVWELLQKASQLIRLKLHSAYGTQTERTEARKEARRRLTNFHIHAQDVLQSLNQRLTDTRREAEHHRRACLTDEALKDRVYKKILSVYNKKDYQQLSQGYIGTARMITAIADEVESQLKNNTNSAFNRCIREADINLKEEFETRFGALLKQHNNVIEEMLNSPQLPSPFRQLYTIFKETCFKILSIFSKTYALARTIDPTLSSQIWTMVDLAQSLDEILVSPDNRPEYIKLLTKKVFAAMTKTDAIKSAVEKHLKGTIDYMQACKDAIPRLKEVDEQILQDAETETRSAAEIRTIYEPRLDKVTELAEKLCGFYTTDIKKHEFDLAIGKPSSWKPPKEGGQGRVYRVQLSKDGGTFTAAVKIPKELPAGETYANFVREAENLR